MKQHERQLDHLNETLICIGEQLGAKYGISMSVPMESTLCDLVLQKSGHGWRLYQARREERGGDSQLTLLTSCSMRRRIVAVRYLPALKTKLEERAYRLRGELEETVETADAFLKELNG